MTKKVVHLNEAGTPTGLITFTFDDKMEETFDLSKVNDETKLRLMIHGASQKVGDSYAGAAKAENPLDFAKESVKETIAQLYAGDWRAAGAGVGGPRTTDLATALARVTGKTVEQAAAYIDTLADEEKKALKAKGKVAAALAAITAERAAERAKKLAEQANAGTTEADESVDFDVPNAA